MVHCDWPTFAIVDKFIIASMINMIFAATLISDVSPPLGMIDP